MVKREQDFTCVVHVVVPVNPWPIALGVGGECSQNQAAFTSLNLSLVPSLDLVAHDYVSIPTK